MAAAPEPAPAPAPLVLFTMVSKDCVDESSDLNKLKMQMQCGECEAEDAWHIGFRTRAADAVDRAIKVEGRARVSKVSHMILRVEFSALGVAHFGTTCQGSSLQFLPALYKKSYQGATDWGVWHLLCDLPLSLNDVMGNTLVSSEWMEII